MEIYLIRHTSVALKENICYGQSDVGLSSTFSEELFEIQNKLPKNLDFKFYASPLSRCKLLAEKLTNQNIIFDDRLKEMNFGDWELKTWNEIGKVAFDVWHSDFVTNKVPGGESYAELSKRVISIWKEIVSETKNSVLITHGGVIRALLAYTLGLPLENSFCFKIDFAGISKVVINGNFLTVEYVNR